jgi:hypothetical protein
MKTASLICVLLLAGVPAIRAQQTPAPVAAAQPATLVASCDVDCTWRLDGKDQGALKKKEKTNVPVALGEHLVEAASTDGVYLWEKKVEVDKSKVDVKINLFGGSPHVDTRGLMWAPRSKGHDITFEEAIAYCEKLKIGPYTGWRLPAYDELQYWRGAGILSSWLRGGGAVRGDGLCRIRRSNDPPSNTLTFPSTAPVTGTMCSADTGHNDAHCVRETPKLRQMEKETAEKMLEKYKAEQAKLLAKQAKKNDESGDEQSSVDEQVKKNEMLANHTLRYLESLDRSASPANSANEHLRDFSFVAHPSAASPAESGAASVSRPQPGVVLVRVDVSDDTHSGRLGLKNTNFNVTADGRAVDVRYFREVISSPATLSAGLTYFEFTGRGAWAKAQSQPFAARSYYVLEFTPPETVEGDCHQIVVKIDKAPGKLSAPPSPARYCYSRGEDPLAGTALGDDLERKANGSEKGSLDLELAARPFYVAPNMAQVQINLSFFKDEIHLSEESATSYNVRTHVVGAIYGKDGKLAARFSDNYDQAMAGTQGGYADLAPMQYATELNLPPGEYTLKVALSDGKDFGAAKTSFRVDSFEGHALGLSAIALTTHVRSLLDARFDSPQLPAAKPSPLVSQGVQYLPEATQSFDVHEPLYLYFELYEPALPAAGVPRASRAVPVGDASTPDPSAVLPKVEYLLRVVDTGGGVVTMDTGHLDASRFIQSGSIVVPIGQRLNLERLDPGCYRLEVQGFDSLGQQTPVRTEAFCVQ